MKYNYGEYLNKYKEIGEVTQVHYPIAILVGLPNVSLKELVIFETGEIGQVYTMSQNEISVLLLSPKIVDIGTKATRTGETIKISTEQDFLGKLINPIGESLEYEKRSAQENIDISKNQRIENEKLVKEEEPIQLEDSDDIDALVEAININLIKDEVQQYGPSESRREFNEDKSSNEKDIEGTLYSIDKRENIKDPFVTGVSLVDTFIPIGMGQRELIIGERKTGKTAFALAALRHQVNQGIIGIYAMIGYKMTEIKKVQLFLKKNNLEDKVALIASTANDSPGLIYLTPFTAMTIAESIRDKGKNTIIVLDDLSTHARYYRQLSLISKSFPGRESYPGDIFFVHARLLERAGCFTNPNDPNKPVSITCLPIAQTIEADLSGFIQTNLMSITDGHIFFDKNIFAKGMRPAINIALSVTRAGKQTLNPLRKDINKILLNFMVKYEKMEKMAQFGSELTQEAKTILKKGKLYLQMFSQHYSTDIDINVQLVIVSLIWIEAIEAPDLDHFKKNLNDQYKNNHEVRMIIDTIVDKSSFAEFNDTVKLMLEKIKSLIK